jgi:GH15 family glucan-1,4-alpha-glucosidase
MCSRIEDYALIGDLETCALIARDGSIDWLCLPRFDSGACFAALLGTPEHGRWLLAPAGDIRAAHRRYRPGTLVLETTFETPDGSVLLTDFMPVRTEHPVLVRQVRGLRGQVPMRLELIIRLDYGSIVPWVQRAAHGIRAVAGPDALLLETEVKLHGKNLTTAAEFTVSEGQEIPFVLRWHRSYEKPQAGVDPAQALQATDRWWRDWSGRCDYQGPWREQVLRSLITLKALTYAPTGGIVAAATTSLPEQLGGVRNWDYRICWLRDATFTLMALLGAGFKEEARAWRQWLLRAVAGQPSELQIMYSLDGSRRLSEWQVRWLPGYEGARPVRVGNAASEQFQLDVYGEVIDSMYQARRHGLEEEKADWQLERVALDFLEPAWQKPDDGIWEVRGPRRHFTHSKVMAWVAFDRAVKAVEQFGLDGPVERWRQARAAVHEQVCREGYSPKLGSFVQSYGSEDLDASLLMLPLVGFLPASDPRVAGTVAAIEKHLLRDGFVQRYATGTAVDGLPPGEGAFLPCTFWLADNYALLGREDDGKQLYERLLGLCNDVGLLSEEYDSHAGRLVGNFPQAFSHVGLVNTARNLTHQEGPARQRQDSSGRRVDVSVAALGVPPRWTAESGRRRGAAPHRRDTEGSLRSVAEDAEHLVTDRGAAQQGGRTQAEHGHQDQFHREKATQRQQPQDAASQANQDLHTGGGIDRLASDAPAGVRPAAAVDHQVIETHGGPAAQQQGGAEDDGRDGGQDQRHQAEQGQNAQDDAGDAAEDLDAHTPAQFRRGCPGRRRLG